MGDLQPLTDDEAALLCHITRWGSDGYPIEKVGPCWQIVSFKSWPGYPTTYKTKKAATEQFRRWLGLALERWAAMKREHPGAILTAVGIRSLEADPEVYACPDGERCADPGCLAENERRDKSKRRCWSCRQLSDRLPGAALCSRCSRNARIDAMGSRS